MKIFLLLNLIILSFLPLHAAKRLELGFGDRYDQVINGKRVVIYQEAKKDGMRFKYAALWLTPGWTQWVSQDKIRQIVRDGYTPLLIYYTFGDKSSKEYLEANKGAVLNAWYQDIEKNLTPLVNIDSEVLIALEPEFNVIPASGTPITAWKEWNDIAGKAIDILHQGAPKVKVGLCPGDWGNYNLETSMAEAAKKSDFIAFPEMRASTDPSMNTKTPHYRDVIGSAVAFTGYLKKTFNKPILFAYLALSSYTKSDPRGWESLQAKMIEGIFRREEELVKNGVFGLAYFAYYDDSGHKTEFFGEAEKYFGLKDAQGKPKKAWRVWKKRSR